MKETQLGSWVEESVPPAERLGKHYFVTQPTGPEGAVVGHVVRLYGNVDGTNRTYPQGAPDEAPSMITAGAVVDLGVVDEDFEIVADRELAVASFQMGGQAVDPTANPGDPSMSTLVAVEQYRTKYVFLAPDDYETSYVDAVHPMTAKLTLNGKDVDTKPTEIGHSGFGVSRIRLADTTTNGVQVLESDVPFASRSSDTGSTRATSIRGASTCVSSRRRHPSNLPPPPGPGNHGVETKVDELSGTPGWASEPHPGRFLIRKPVKIS
jgi:hypothetical protein